MPKFSAFCSTGSSSLQDFRLRSAVRNRFGKGTKMSRSENLQTNDKAYYVPMEVTDATIRDLNIDPNTVKLRKIGNRTVRVILVKSDKETYDTYMHSEWKEDKYQQRHGYSMSSLDSLLSAYGIELTDNSSSVEGEVMKREFIRILRLFLSKLEEMDRTIVLMHLGEKSERDIAAVVGMSQRGVGKRLKRLMEELQELLKDFKNYSFI